MKIPVTNVYYLLCYAWNKLEESETIKIEPTQSTELVDLFARVLINGLDHLLKKGIDRGYVAHSEESRVLRGKLELQATLKRSLLSRGQVHCEYDDLSYDVRHNQIVKTTVNRLVRTDNIDPKNQAKLTDLRHRLGGVRLIELTKQVFGQVQLHRNNYIYGFLLRVCELLYDNLLPTEKAGAWRFRSFSQDQMASLFESFVRNFYKREVPLVYGKESVKVGREDILWKVTPGTEEAAGLLPKMQTDVCIRRKHKKIIVECKYTADPLRVGQYGGLKLIEEHLYQLNSYLDNLIDDPLNNECRAILLYPLAARQIRPDYTRSKGQTISVRTLDLTQEWKGIHRDLLALIA
ncbi:MAG TPA: 5-methylcytosine-specific restriction endonuclease system specificity protein McrC [Candidatus Acidoferrum sp.]|nr:5-methylcytosine-specific restriction endonuclease system specificity protein McrC [Candidatus Acidoferrum sp.]